jgi:guanosine-3',5'-bis(diphosphate) 3'-pyrophosphohydrolase
MSAVAKHQSHAPKGTPKPSPAALNAAAASFAALTARLDYLSPEDTELVRRAYRFADEAHLGQLRNSGEPYITHPIAVAAQCAEWKLDAQALMAALLHDAIEDCGVTKPELIERFGAPVAELVDGLTKLDKLQFNTREENQAESFRKMLLAMARDVRVILVKLADRTHNMRTLADAPREKWARISRETLEIYAPIAHRLGLNQTYRELQELSFRHLKPWRYATLSKAVAKARGRRRDLIQKVQKEVEAAFSSAGMTLRIAGREKTLYSIYRKMEEKHLSFAQVTDIYGFRLIVPNVIACYTGLGILHQMYKPLPGKFKDHIAISKLNGYQSLHTTLVGPAGVSVEFQLRTEAMHVVAESGVAAHWLYKAAEPNAASNDRLGTKWLQSLLDIQDETRDAAEFWDHVKVDLFPDAVYVFTPKSQIMALPRGATVVDFAYAIHSNIGDHTSAARINGDQVPLRTELKNGDVVEVITAPVSTPNPAWLGFVRTGRARSKIRHYLKTLAHAESEGLGEKLLAQALRAEGLEQAARERRRAPAAVGKAAALHRQPHPLRIADRHRPGQAHREHRRQAAHGTAFRTGRAARCAAAEPRALHFARNRVARRGHARWQRKLIGSFCAVLPPDSRRPDRRLSRPRRRPGGAYRRLRRRPAPAPQGQRALLRRRVGGRAHARLRNRGGDHRAQRQGRAGAGRRHAGRRRSRHHARGNGRRDAAGFDRPALRDRGARPHAPRCRAARRAPDRVGADRGPDDSRALRDPQRATPRPGAVPDSSPKESRLRARRPASRASPRRLRAP